MKTIWQASSAFLVSMAIVTACARTNSAETQMGNEGYTQIERLARPAINEGLVITNAFLNAFNSIPPSADLTPGAASVVAEAGSVLTAIYNYGRDNNLDAPPVASVVAGFLPDVMRIDARARIGIGTWAFNGDSTMIGNAAMLTGGRKIEDDTPDIILSYLIAGNPACGPGRACAVPDGTSYAGGTSCSNAGRGSNPANPGHKCLYGQTQRNGSAEFPFLASPN